MTIIAVSADEFMTPKSRGNLSHLEPGGIPAMPNKNVNLRKPPAPGKLFNGDMPKFTTMVKSEVHVEGLNEEPDLGHDNRLPNVVIPNLIFPPNGRPKLLSPRSRNYISIDPLKFPPPGLNEAFEEEFVQDVDGKLNEIDLYSAGTKIYAMSAVQDPPLEGGSREVVNVEEGAEGVIVEPGEKTVLVAFDALGGKQAYVDKALLGLGCDPSRAIRAHFLEPPPFEGDANNPTMSPRTRLNLMKLTNMNGNAPHTDIDKVNSTYKTTHKLNPYPALSKVPPFEVHFERPSLQVPWGFKVRQITHNDDVQHTRVWNNYIRSPRSKQPNIFILDAVEMDVANSEIQQWNEYHANEFGDFYHTVHRNDRVLKVNDTSANEDPKQFFDAFNRNLKLTLVVEKRDITREMEITKLDVTIPEAVEGQEKKPLGARLKMTDGRFLAFDAIDTDSILADYNTKFPGFINVGDKILGANRVPGEAHVDLLNVLKSGKRLEMVLGRPLNLTPRKGIVNFVHEGESFDI